MDVVGGTPLFEGIFTCGRLVAKISATKSSFIHMNGVISAARTCISTSPKQIN